MKLSDLFGGGVDPTLTDFPDPVRDIEPGDGGTATAVFAGGCFWCTEAVFKRLEGVLSVTSGYAGGTKETADYQTVCSGTTDHAEVIQIRLRPGADFVRAAVEGVFRRGPRSNARQSPGERPRPAVSLGDLLRRRGSARDLADLHHAAEQREDFARRRSQPPWSRSTSSIKPSSITRTMRRGIRISRTSRRSRFQRFTNSRRCSPTS